MGGIYAASVTAFDKNGNLNADAQQQLMDKNLQEGAAGLSVEVLQNVSCYLQRRELSHLKWQVLTYRERIYLQMLEL